MEKLGSGQRSANARRGGFGCVALRNATTLSLLSAFDHPREHLHGDLRSPSSDCDRYQALRFPTSMVPNTGDRQIGNRTRR